ncbi:MAG: serine hydroxymethyltransferase [Patescibacteria group bacterium]
MTTSIQDLIKAEKQRQESTLSLIASENATSQAVLDAAGSVLTNKYSEGYPYKRYYGGNEIVDQIEERAQNLAKQLFGADHVNVQPYSGSPANMAIYFALLEFGDQVMGMSLPHGGHLTHGHKVSFSGAAYNFSQYGVDPEAGLLNYEEIATMARIMKPKMIVCGASAYPREIDFAKFGEIAKEVGAYLFADISHIAGLVAAGVHPSPFPHADVVMTTTHKTLRGPRSAIIMCKEELAKRIDKAVFPGLQGGPHNHITAAKAICFEEALTPEFKEYGKQIILNAQALAHRLMEHGFKLVTDGTDTHLMLIDLTNKGVTGQEAEDALTQVGIIINKNMVPGDLRSPMDPSGIRLGVALLTTRGMKEGEMQQIADLINQVVVKNPDSSVISSVAQEVTTLCAKFPIYK